MGGVTAPGARAQKRRSRGLFAEGHDPKEGGGLCPNHGSSRTKRVSRARERDRRARPSGPAPPARAQDPHHPPDREPLLQVSQTVPAPDERAEGDGVGLILLGGEGFRGGEGSRVLAPHEAGPGRDRRREGRPDLGPALGARFELPVEQAARPPLGGQRVLLRARRGLQSLAGPLPGHLAARALGPDESRARSSPTGSGGTCIRAGRASSTSSTTGPPRRPARSPASSRAT